MAHHPKIALIGCRNVAPASAYSLLNGPNDVEVVLFGEHAATLLGAVSDLNSEMPFKTRSTIRPGEPADLKDADICVLSSGLPPHADDTEDSFLRRNVELVRRDGNFLHEEGFKGILIVTTSPAEVMAQVAMEASGISAAHVIGLGPNVAAGFENAVAGKLPLATWCSASGCSTEFIDSCHPDCPYFEEMLERFHRFQLTPNRRSASTMASCVMRVCEAVLGNEKAALPVLAMLSGEHGISGTFANVPCVIGRNGVERVLELPISEIERAEMSSIAQINAKLFRRLAGPATAVAGAGKNL